MKIPIPKTKKDRSQVEAALAEVDKIKKEQETYQYSLKVNRTLMADFMGLCKLEKSSAPQEITKFIERYVKARESKLK